MSATNRTSKENSNKPRFQQILEGIIWRIIYRLSPLEYQMYNFGKKNVGVETLKTYLLAHQEFLPLLNSAEWLPVLENPIVFNTFFRNRGLPLPEFYGVFHPLFGYENGGKPLRSQEDMVRWLDKTRPKRFTLLPLEKKQDKNTITVIGDLFFDSSSTKYSLEELVSYLSRDITFKHQGYILQQSLNHPEMDSANSLTCNVVTLRDHKGQIDLLFALAKLGPEEGAVDSSRILPVDLQSGKIGKGTHPSSFPNLDIENQQVPDWEQVIELAAKAALLIPGVHSVAWEIAISETGPVLIHGDGTWSPLLGQAYVGGLLTNELRQKLQHFGLTFPK